METNNTTNNIAKIRVIFFKENGKYYTEDTVVIPSDDMQVFQIVDWIKDNVKTCKGMHLFAMLNELEHGYPIMIPANQR